MISLLFFIGLLSLAGALICLAALAWIDLQVRLLPDTYVLAFGLFGLAFHASGGFSVVSPWDMVAGILAGGGLLYGVRFFANRIYKQDALGLGDVKLMMAAGVWLGAHDVLLAIIAGACAGIVHGLVIYMRQKGVLLARFSLPAGPGFIVGILIAGALKFWPWAL